MPTHHQKNAPPPGYLELRVPDTKGLPLVTANFFNLAWSGGIEVQLDLGYMDLGAVARASAPTSSAGRQVHAEISHRVFMSVRGFAMLYKQVVETAAKLKQQGVPLDELQQMEAVE